jgi:phosphoribosyl-dephospho-CoA transferase
MEFTTVTILPRPHDLLRLCGAAHDLLPADAPGWTLAALRTAPWVVARRAVAPPGRIAVGVRGSSRSQRYPTTVSAADIVEATTPENLAHAEPRPGRDLPAMRALSVVRVALDAAGTCWGPTGSVGFELATGVLTATAESDLDLLLRAPGRTRDALPRLTALHRQLGQLPVRIDCQVETASGAIALAELIGGQPTIMVRTAAGPALVSRAAAMP